MKTAPEVSKFNFQRLLRILTVWKRSFNTQYICTNTFSYVSSHSTHASLDVARDFDFEERTQTGVDLHTVSTHIHTQNKSSTYSKVSQIHPSNRHIVNSALVNRLAQGAGLTALHYAARRGDVEIVTLLLEIGADPRIKNEMGLDSFGISEKFGPFPSVRRVLEKYDSRTSK